MSKKLTFIARRPIYVILEKSAYIFNFIHHQVVAHKKKKQYKHN